MMKHSELLIRKRPVSKNINGRISDDSLYQNVQSDGKIVGGQVLKLDAKIKTAWTILGQVNQSICLSTTAVILENKPIFDEQKIILIKLGVTIESIYMAGLNQKFTSFNVAALSKMKLEEKTLFGNWNKLAVEINELSDLVVQLAYDGNVVENLVLQDDYMRSVSSKYNKKANKKSCSIINIACIVVAICFCFAIFVFLIYFNFLPHFTNLDKRLRGSNS